MLEGIFFLRKFLLLMNIVSAATAGLTVSAAMTGHTHVLWETIAMWATMAMWAPNDWPHFLLWAPMAGHTEVSPPPSIHRPVYADLPPSRLFCPLPQVFCPSWWGGGWCLNHCPLAHCCLRHYVRLCRDIELTPRITTRMSSVGSLATDSRSSRHY